MKSLRRKWWFVSFSLLAVLALAIVWQSFSSSEPNYSGKRLSVWLDELSALDFSKRADTNTPQVQAVRSIGTNAIPWLMSELKRNGKPWEWRINHVLQKQHFIKYRFPDINTRLSRATLGFEALDGLGEPAVPELLGLVETKPGYIPTALAGIGAPALPALAQCLTNTKSYATSAGSMAPIPGNTIGAIYNAITGRRISKSEAAMFLPMIRAWAQSTNQHAVRYASQFLNDFHLTLSTNETTAETLEEWK